MITELEDYEILYDYLLKLNGFLSNTDFLNNNITFRKKYVEDSIESIINNIKKIRSLTSILNEIKLLNNIINYKSSYQYVYTMYKESNIILIEVKNKIELLKKENKYIEDLESNINILKKEKKEENICDDILSRIESYNIFRKEIIDSINITNKERKELSDKDKYLLDKKIICYWKDDENLESFIDKRCIEKFKELDELIFYKNSDKNKEHPLELYMIKEELYKNIRINSSIQIEDFYRKLTNEYYLNILNSNDIGQKLNLYDFNILIKLGIEHVCKTKIDVEYDKADSINKLNKILNIVKNNDVSSLFSSNETIFDYIDLFELMDSLSIKDKISILLFLDSAHDFKSERINDKKDKIDNETIKEEKIFKGLTLFDFYLKKIKENKVENKDTNFILSSLINNNIINNIIDIANNLDETEFFYTYISYYFLKKSCSKINDNELSSFISVYKKENDLIYSLLWSKIPFISEWNRDFKGTSVKKDAIDIEKLVYLSSSLVDANKTNSINKYSDFYTSQINNNFIVWAGQNFNYKYSKTNCELIVSSSDNNFKLKSNCDFKDYPLFGDNKTSFYLQNKDKNELIPYNSNKKLDLKKYSLVYIDKASGPSVKTIYELIKEQFNLYNGNLSLSFLDSMFSLKRIGDLGQIVESRLYNIPLYTDDKMEVLISIALGNSVITSLGNKYFLWYDGNTDSFRSILSFNSYIESLKDNSKSSICYDIKRINSTEYIKELEELDWIGKIKVQKNNIPKFNCNTCDK